MLCDSTSLRSPEPSNSQAGVARWVPGLGGGGWGVVFNGDRVSVWEGGTFWRVSTALGVCSAPRSWPLASGYDGRFVSCLLYDS